MDHPQLAYGATVRSICPCRAYQGPGTSNSITFAFFPSAPPSDFCSGIDDVVVSAIDAQTKAARRTTLPDDTRRALPPPVTSGMA
jgi:hypothetical protein